MSFSASRRPWDPSIKFWQGRDGKYHDMRGENARTSKLTAEQVAIIKAAPETVGTARLARQYGVTFTTIRRARDGVTWSHVEPGTWPPNWWDEGEG